MPRLNTREQALVDVRLFRIVIPVDDLEVGVSFYSAVFGVSGKRVSPGRHYFSSGQATVCIYSAIEDGDPERVGPNPTPMYFLSTDVEEIFERVKLIPGLRVIGDLATRPWGERSFYVNDPFGNALCFVDSNTVFTGQFYVE